MPKNAETRISIHFQGALGFLIVRPPDSDVRLHGVGPVDVEPIDDRVPFFVDDGETMSLMMRRQQQQYSQFLAAIMANGGMFEI